MLASTSRISQQQRQPEMTAVFVFGYIKELFDLLFIQSKLKS